VNKKYFFLDDKKWLFEQLQSKSMAELASELAETYKVDKASLAGSIRFIVYRYFTKLERNLIKKERAFHKNKRKPVDI
jgi:hypothetical protein